MLEGDEVTTLGDVRQLEQAIDECRVISGPFAIGVQFFLAFVVLSTLLYKRQMEKPQRGIVIWLMDISKQGFAMCLQHFVNVALAVIFASQKGRAGECIWYITNFCITVVGGIIVLTCWMKIHGYLVDRYDWTWLKSGQYGGDGTPGSAYDVRIWLVQTIYWGVICCMEKFVVAGLVIFPLHSSIDRAIAPLEEPWRAYPKLELVFLMLIAPSILNPLWSWIIDNLVKDPKWGHGNSHSHDEVKGYSYGSAEGLEH